MNNKITELIIALVFIAVGMIFIIFGRQLNNFLEKIGIEYLANDSSDAARSRQMLGGIAFIGIGIYIIITSFKG